MKYLIFLVSCFESFYLLWDAQCRIRMKHSKWNGNACPLKEEINCFSFFLHNSTRVGGSLRSFILSRTPPMVEEQKYNRHLLIQNSSFIFICFLFQIKILPIAYSWACDIQFHTFTTDPRILVSFYCNFHWTVNNNFVELNLIVRVETWDTKKHIIFHFFFKEKGSS